MDHLWQGLDRHLEALADEGFDFDGPPAVLLALGARSGVARFVDSLRLIAAAPPCQECGRAPHAKLASNASMLVQRASLQTAARKRHVRRLTRQRPGEKNAAWIIPLSAKPTNLYILLFMSQGRCSLRGITIRLPARLADSGLSVWWPCRLNELEAAWYALERARQCNVPVRTLLNVKSDDPRLQGFPKPASASWSCCHLRSVTAQLGLLPPAVDDRTRFVTNGGALDTPPRHADQT